MSYFYDIFELDEKTVRIHKAVVKEIQSLDTDLRIQIAELLDLIASGQSLGMPVSRPMSNIAIGVHELRIKDSSGQYRVFYFTKMRNSILVFHFFKKKTQTTPKKEMELAKKRLRRSLK